MFYVYFLQSLSKLDQFYIGYSSNFEDRIKTHNAGLVQSTRPYIPWELIFYEAYKNQKDAKRREEYLKRVSEDDQGKKSVAVHA